jgi:hypothetical protein
MASTITDVAEYGNLRGRDAYLRDMYQAVKGDGTNPSSVSQSFYGIQSSTDTEYSLSSVTVSEGAVDDEIATYTVRTSDGTSLVDVLQLNDTLSTLTADTVNLTATDVVVPETGTLHVAVMQADTLAESARIELNSDPTDPTMNFIVGDLAGTPTNVLTITEAGADVVGSLTVDGVDLLGIIDSANVWQSAGATVDLEAAYNLVNINTLNTYTASVALDINGSIVNRGNNLYMYDTTGLANLSTLNYDSTANSLLLRTSLADQAGNTDSVVVQTTNGTDNTYLNRLTFGGGLGDQNATFSNVNVGIGVTPSGTHRLEVVGTSSLTGNATVVGDVDLSGNDLNNVSDITSSDTLAEQASITLTSSATDPQIDFVLGDLAGAPVTAMTLTEAAATLNVATTVTDDFTVTGNLTVNGTTTTVNTSEVEVEDKAIDLAYSTTDHTLIDGGGIILGKAVSGITTPSILYSETDTRWDTSVGVNVPAASKVTVDGTTTELSSTGLDLNADTSVIHLGATKQWRIRMENDGTNDHLYFEHDDLGTQTTWETKLDIMQ